MTTNAFSGVGTLFKRSADSTGGLATVAEVNSITGPNMTRETIDVTSLDSSGGYREFIASFRDSGEVTLNMNHTLIGYGDFKADFEASTARIYQITLSNTEASTLTFLAYVTSVTMGVPTDDKVTMDITIKITGQVTLAS